MATVLKLGPPAPSRRRDRAFREIWRTWVAPIQWRVLGYALLTLLAYGAYRSITDFGAMVLAYSNAPCGCLKSGR